MLSIAARAILNGTTDGHEQCYQILCDRLHIITKATKEPIMADTKKKTSSKKKATAKKKVRVARVLPHNPKAPGTTERKLRTYS